MSLLVANAQQQQVMEVRPINIIERFWTVCVKAQYKWLNDFTAHPFAAGRHKAQFLSVSEQLR